jgi:hypothetical protein
LTQNFNLTDSSTDYTLKPLLTSKKAQVYVYRTASISESGSKPAEISNLLRGVNFHATSNKFPSINELR